MKKTNLDFRRNNPINNQEMLLSVYDLTARSSLQIQQRPRHQSQSREKYHMRRNGIYNRSENKPDTIQLASISSPGSTKKLPYSPHLKKVPSPRETSFIMQFVQVANEAIENNTDERIIRQYLQLRNQIEQLIIPQDVGAANGLQLQIDRLKLELEQSKKREAEGTQFKEQITTLQLSLAKIQKKAESRKVCIKRLYQILDKKERELELYKTGKLSCKNSFNQGEKKIELNEILNNVYQGKNKENQGMIDQQSIIQILREIDPKVYEAISHINNTQGDFDAKEAERSTIIQQSLKNLRQFHKLYEESAKYCQDISDKHQEIWKRYLEVDVKSQKSIQQLKVATIELEGLMKNYGSFLKINGHPLSSKYQETSQFQQILGEAIVKQLTQLRQIQDDIDKKENEQLEHLQFKETLYILLKELMQNHKIGYKENDIKGILDCINSKLYQMQDEINRAQEARKTVKIDEYLQTRLRSEQQQFDQQLKQLKEQNEQLQVQKKDIQSKYDQLQVEYNKQTQVSLSALQHKQQEISQLFEQTKRLKEDITKSQEIRLTYNEQRDQISQLKKEVERQSHVILELQQFSAQQEHIIENNKNEITRLHDVILSLQNQNSENESNFRQNQEDESKTVLGLIEKNQRLQEFAKDLQIEYAALEEEFKQIQQQNTEFYSQNQRDQDSIEVLRKQNQASEQASKQRIQELLQLSEKQTNEIKTLQELIVQSDLSFQSLNQELDQNRIQLEQSKKNFELVSSQKDQFKSQLEQTKSQLEQSSAQLEQSKKQLELRQGQSESIVQSNQLLKQQNDSLKLLNEGLAGKINDADLEIDQLKQKLYQIASLLDKEQSTSASYKRDLDQATEQLHQSLAEFQQVVSEGSQKLQNEAQQSEVKDRMILELQESIKQSSSIISKNALELEALRERIHVAESSIAKNESSYTSSLKLLNDKIQELEQLLKENQRQLKEREKEFERQSHQFAEYKSLAENQVRELEKNQGEQLSKVESEKLEITRGLNMLRKELEQNQNTWKQLLTTLELNDENDIIMLKQQYLILQKENRSQQKELENQRSLLASQATDADKGKRELQLLNVELKEKLLVQEGRIQKLCDDVSEKVEQIKQLNNRVSENQEQHMIDQSELQKLNTLYNQIQIELKNQEKEASIKLAKVTCQLKCMESTVSTTQIQNEQLHLQLELQIGQLDQLQSLIETLKQQSQQHLQTIEGLNQKFANHDKLHKEQIQDFEFRIEKLVEQEQHLQQQLHVASSEKKQLEATIGRLQAEQSMGLDAERQQYEEKTNLLELELDQAAHELSEKEAQIQKLRDIERNLGIQIEANQKDFFRQLEEAQLRSSQQLATLNQQYEKDVDILRIQVTEQEAQLENLVQIAQYIGLEFNLEMIDLENIRNAVEQIKLQCENLFNKSQQLEESIDSAYGKLVGGDCTLPEQQLQTIVNSYMAIMAEQNLVSQKTEKEIQKKCEENETILKQVSCLEQQINEKNELIQNQLHKIAQCSEEIIQLQQLSRDCQEVFQTQLSECKQRELQIRFEHEAQVKEHKKLLESLQEDGKRDEVQHQEALCLMKQGVEELQAKFDQLKDTAEQSEKKLQTVAQELETENILSKIQELKQVEARFLASTSEAKSVEAYCQQLDSLLQEFLYNKVNLTMQSLKSLLTEAQRQNINEYRKKIGELQSKILSSEKNYKLMEDARFNLQQYQQIVDKSEQKALYFESECKKKDLMIQELQQKKRGARSSLEMEEQEDDDCSNQTMNFLDFSFRQEVLYGDQSFFQEISYVEQSPAPVIDLHRHCKEHIFSLLEKCNLLRETLQMSQEDHNALHA